MLLNYKQLGEIKIINSDLENLRIQIEQDLNIERETIHIITFNLDFYYTAEHNKIFRSICGTAELVVPDGHGITSLLLLKHKQNIKRITGNELFELLLDISNKKKLKVAFVGSTPEVMAGLTKKVGLKYPDLKIAAALTPPLNFETDDKINNRVVNELTLSGADILFAALGSPRQEIWLNNYKTIIRPKVCIGVGAAFDFYTNAKKRSPAFLQVIRLEWFWRLLNEPGRMFRRYIINDIPFFIKHAIKILLNYE